VKLKLLTQNKYLARLLKNNLGYLGSELLSLTNTESRDNIKATFSKAISTKVIVIVARQHYLESWQTYPAISSKELKSILTLQQKNQSGFKSIQRIVTNKEQDGFDVKTITFNEKVQTLLPANTLLIPETELLRNLINDDGRLVVQIDTPNGLLYWAHSTNKVHSAYKKGFLSSLEAFVQSVGLPQGLPTQQVPVNYYPQLILDLIESTLLTKLVDIISVRVENFIDVNRLHRLYLTPLAVATVFVLVSNSYLYLQKSWLSSQIEETSSVTSGLLSQKRQIVQLEQLVNVVNQEFSRLEATHATWELLAKAMAAEMRVTRFKRFEQGIELRGTAPKASKVLSELNTMEQVSDAAFTGSVRKSRGLDAFTILLQFNSKQVVSKKNSANIEGEG